MTNTENVQLTIPAVTEYEAVAITTIAHLAVRRGFSLKEVEDLRLIMAETTKLLTGLQRQGSTLQLNYNVSERQVHLDAFAKGSYSGPLAEKDITQFRTSVGALLDYFLIDNAKHWVSLTKDRLG
ncbi:MAG: hypothetical protein P8J01_08675 [Acidimicrobiales bacterium]|jgi:hypothetical protein|nr:hypothetical protein [Acidimicrobiales bacterium]MDG1846454.1 hypothetical protein [Acidimicrobiales bacterium]